MFLHALAHLRNGALRGDTQHLRKGERTNCLNHSGATYRQGKGQEQFAVVLTDDLINQVFVVPRVNCRYLIRCG